MQYGTALRRGVSDAKGSVIVIADPALPYPVSAIGDAVAMVEIGATDVVFASHARRLSRAARSCAGCSCRRCPIRSIQLAAFSNTAAKIVVGESRLTDGGCELELAFLANKYGFRVEHLVVDSARRARATLRRAGGVVPAIADPHGQSPPRVSRRAAMSGLFLVRGLDVRADPRQRRPRVPALQMPLPEPIRGRRGDASRPPRAARARAARRRRRTSRIPRPRASAPASGGSTGCAGSSRRARAFSKSACATAASASLAASDYEYVGIDPASAAARHARARGLEVYCASLSSFVNIGPAFDAHHALPRLREHGRSARRARRASRTCSSPAACCSCRRSTPKG